MQCKNCGTYYRLSRYNDTGYCETCPVSSSDVPPDEDFDLEKDLLTNPSGKTRPIFYDDDPSGYDLL